MSETPHSPPGHVYVSELEHWLEENSDRLDAIAQRTSASASLVHLAAVLVLNGLTDQQIHDQFMVLEPRLADEHRPLEPVWAALPLIRDLQTGADGGRDGDVPNRHEQNEAPTRRERARTGNGKKRGGRHDASR